MGTIINLHDDPHLATEALLPWYVSGVLDAAEAAGVESHLAGCADCQAALALERRLKSEVAALPIDAAPGWDRLKARLDAATPARRPVFRGWRAMPAWAGWALAAQAALIAVFGVLIAPADYHALSAAPPPAAGNIVVIFRPETPERDLRAALVADKLRLVDGPTASDAYVLAAPPAVRAAILARLRARRDIVLAEPIGGSR